MATVAVGYQSTTADWRAKERSRNIPLHRGTMDAAELAFLIRRLPLADGYSTAVPLLDEAGVVRKVGVAVKGIEQVKAPAGEFRCFMVETEIVPGRVQTFWIAAEPSRALIKTAMVADRIGHSRCKRTDLSKDSGRRTKR